MSSLLKFFREIVFLLFGILFLIEFVFNFYNLLKWNIFFSDFASDVSAFGYLLFGSECKSFGKGILVFDIVHCPPVFPTSYIGLNRFINSSLEFVWTVEGRTVLLVGIISHWYFKK